MYEALLKGVDISELHNSRQEITDILRWVLTGYNNSFLLSVDRDKSDIEELKKDYIKQLKKHLQVLKNGL